MTAPTPILVQLDVASAARLARRAQEGQCHPADLAAALLRWVLTQDTLADDEDTAT